MSQSRRVWKHNHLDEPYEECPTLEEYIGQLCSLISVCFIADVKGEHKKVRQNLYHMKEILVEMAEGEWRVRGDE